MKKLHEKILKIFSIYAEILAVTGRIIETTLPDIFETTTIDAMKLMELPFRFDGMDWDLVNKDAFQVYHGKERTPCRGEFVHCIRATTPLVKVCAFNHITWSFEDYYNQCEIVLENCQYRTKWSGSPTHPRHNAAYFNGLTYGCYYYLRRSANIQEFENLYFSMGHTTKAKVLAMEGIHEEPPAASLNEKQLRSVAPKEEPVDTKHFMPDNSSPPRGLLLDAFKFSETRDKNVDRPSNKIYG